MRKTYCYPLIALGVVFLAWRFVRPMNIFVVDEKFARPMKVEVPEGLDSLSAGECGGCHEAIYEEWSQSMHAKAWTDPYYQIDYVFDGSQQICLNCHIPLENQQEDLVVGFRDREMFKPILEPNPNFDPTLQSEGVTCAVCHVREGRIVGPFATEDAPHPVKYDPEMSSGIRYCEQCHVVSGERWDTFYSIPPCGTVAEIRESGQEIDCVGCHMPETIRPAADGMDDRKVGRHLFRGGHHPERVKGSLKVETKRETKEDGDSFSITLTNVGAAHYFPTGTPDRHLTLELRLLDGDGNLLKEKIHVMKRYILWRPVIVDLKDTRLAYGEPRTFEFSFKPDRGNPPSVLEVTVRYHLLDEKRRERIGYENKEPIAYPIYREEVAVR
jgi:hypothetical protein